MKALVIVPVPDYAWYSGLEGKQVDVSIPTEMFAGQEYCVVLDTEHNYTVIHSAFRKYLPDKVLIIMQDHVQIICEDNEDAYQNLQLSEEDDSCLPLL